MGLYTYFPILTILWEDINMDFVLGFPKKQQGNDFIFVVVDILYNMAHFIMCWNISDAMCIVVLFFKEIVRFMGF